MINLSSRKLSSSTYLPITIIYLSLHLKSHYFLCIRSKETHEFYIESQIRQLTYLVSIPVFNSWWRWRKIFFLLLIKMEKDWKLVITWKDWQCSCQRYRFRKLNLFVVTYPQAEIIFPQFCFLCLLALASALLLLFQDWLKDKFWHSHPRYKNMKQK